MTVVEQKSLQPLRKYLKEASVFQSVRDGGMEDSPRERAMDELHMGEKNLIILACVAKILFSIYFS